MRLKQNENVQNMEFEKMALHLILSAYLALSFKSLGNDSLFKFESNFPLPLDIFNWLNKWKIKLAYQLWKCEKNRKKKCNSLGKYFKKKPY